MSGFLYRGRHYNGNREATLKSKSHTKDFSSDETEKGPPLQTHSLREFEQHLNDLKKENFSLKLRIYFLEERIQQKFEDYSSEDVHKKNIELKVAVESLKQELQEKQQQFDKALATAEGVSDHNEAEVRHCCEERQQEISHIQEVLETKIKLLQEEANLARSEAEKMAILAASESQRCVDLERRMSAEAEVTEKNCSRQTQQEILAEKERLIKKLGESLCSREKEVVSLNKEKSFLTRKVAQLEKEVSIQHMEKDTKTEPDIGRSLKQLEMQKLIGEQQTQLVQYENAAGQCVTELQKSQQQVQALQTKIRESEANNKKLQQRLADMDCELRSVREAAQGQERAIQTLSSSLNIKESEVADLEQLFSEQKELLISLKQQNLQDELQQLQFTGAASGQLHAELLELQTSLFSTQLELQSIQRAQRQAQRREDDLLRTNQRLLTDFHGETHLRQEAEKHNQDLVAALQRARSDLENMQEKWKEAVEEKNRVVEEREGRITALKTSLQHKERLLHDYAELLDEKKEAGGNRDVLIHKLKLRIQDRDRALEHAMDERFACVERKEAEVRKLQLLLREKERDLQKLYGVLSNNEETITSLELLVRGKSLELEQVNEAWKGSQRIQDERETRLACSLTERDTLISQLQTVLHTCAKETEELTSALVSKVPFGSRKIVEELKGRLKLREQLFQKLLAEHNRQAQEHHAYVQELLSIGLSREQYIKDSAEHMVQVVAEQTARLQELRRQVVSEQKRSQNTSELSEDAQYFQEELQLVLSKEREAQRELSILRSTLASNQEQLQAQAVQLNHKLQIRVACPASMEHVDISQADTGGGHEDTRL